MIAEINRRDASSTYSRLGLLKNFSESLTGATAFMHWMTPTLITGQHIAEILCDFLNYRGKPAVVIWDNWPAHKTAERLLTTPGRKTATDVAVDIRYLPAYAPDLNATEQVWKAATIDLLGNYVPTDFEALEWRLDESLALIGNTPELLRNFVRWAGFELDESHWI